MTIEDMQIEDERRAKARATEAAVEHIREMVHGDGDMARFTKRVNLAIQRCDAYCEAGWWNNTDSAWPTVESTKDGEQVVMMRVGRNASHWFHVAVDCEGKFYVGAYCPEDFDDNAWEPGHALHEVNFDDFKDHKIYVGHY